MNAEKPKAFRPELGQRFPFIPLPKALDRARELYRVANIHEVPIGTAVTKAWGYAEKSSGGVQTVAALKAFGLIDDLGSGSSRRVKLSDAALRILRDPRDISPEREQLVRQAALRPAIHREVVEKYQGLPQSDEAFKAYLMFDRKFRDDAVGEFMREFAATMAFAKIGASDTILERPEPETGDTQKRIAVGSYVQWESNGVLQFDRARRVTAVSDDGQWAFVEGSDTGLPMAELSPADTPLTVQSLTIGTAVSPAVVNPSAPPPAPTAPGERAFASGPLPEGKSWRLIVRGEIGASELGKIIRQLEAQKETLEP
jgi:hypothetical protein